jgi:hypothetical protein
MGKVDPQTILRSVEEKYGSCQSYKDIGKVCSDRKNSHNIDLEFNTLFQRPNMLRFDFQSNCLPFDIPGEWHKLNSDGRLFHIDKGLFCEQQHHNSVYSAIHAITPLCETAASMVLPLLFGKEQFLKAAPVQLQDSYRTILDLENTKLLGSEEIDGNKCFVLDGIWISSKEIRLWIAEGDFAILKIEKQNAVTGEGLRDALSEIKGAIDFSEAHDETEEGFKHILEQLASFDEMSIEDEHCSSHETVFSFNDVLFDEPVAPNVFVH